MSDQDLFQQTETPETKQGSDPAVQPDPFADKLKLIQNEQGEPKYKTVEDALEALAHSQNFIETLKTEKQQIEAQKTQFEQELEKRKSVQEAVDQLIKPQAQQNTPPAPTEQEDKKLDESKIEELIQGYLSKQNQSKTEQDNLNKVKEALIKNHGDKAGAVIRERAKELGTTPEQLEQLSKQNPNIVLNLFSGVSNVSQSPTTPNEFTQRQPIKQETPQPTKGLISGGASSKDLMENWLAVKKQTHEKHNIG